MTRSFANSKVRILLILLEQVINKHLMMITFNPFTPNAPFTGYRKGALRTNGLLIKFGVLNTDTLTLPNIRYLDKLTV